jgi:serine/threonine-protein kinase
VQIFVDGKALCDSSPCRISGLSPGSHQLRASAPGLSSGAEQVVEITAGEEAAANIELAAAEPDVQAGGVRVAAAERELTLFVDDRRVGKLPQTVSGLAGGKHWIKLDAEDGSPPIEKSVNVLPGQLIDVDPNPTKRDKVVVTIRLSPDSEGASVTFDDAFLLDFPAELELDPRSTHQLSATKPGYEDYALRIDLNDETTKVIEVALTPAEGAAAHRPRPKPSASSAALAAARKAASKPASAGAADATQGLLNISSVPPSQIILNGRPLGSTPKTAVVVPGDSLQTIVFVHPKMGRRRAQKFVPAGKERTVSIRF